MKMLVLGIAIGVTCCVYLQGVLAQDAPSLSYQEYGQYFGNVDQIIQRCEEIRRDRHNAR
jgi:hypothetical protein